MGLYPLLEKLIPRFFKKDALVEKNFKKVLTRGWQLALMGGLFKFKPRLGIWKSSLTA